MAAIQEAEKEIRIVVVVCRDNLLVPTQPALSDPWQEPLRPGNGMPVAEEASHRHSDKDVSLNVYGARHECFANYESVLRIERRISRAIP
ncbi:hypothetical protein GCM10010531_37350 [Blastococcus jejuensis]|uniref:Uncharacterized protein n=1 Tax=Blastococcus jejuensis TaxID=351224 RepID=A0ABP6PI87_9ACTN